MEQAPQSKADFTVEEYLRAEETAPYRSEFQDGKVIALSGGTARHSLINANLVGILGTLLKKTHRRVFGCNLKLYIEKANHFVYPDGMALCERPIFYRERNDVIQNPLLVVEVLSDAKEAYVRGDKFHKYISLTSLKEYMLVDQHRKQVEVFSRQDEKQWLYQIYREDDQQFYLNALKLTVDIQKIYDKVDWE